MRSKYGNEKETKRERVIRWKWRKSWKSMRRGDKKRGDENGLDKNEGDWRGRDKSYKRQET